MTYAFLFYFIDLFIFVFNKYTVFVHQYFWKKQVELPIVYEADSGNFFSVEVLFTCNLCLTLFHAHLYKCPIKFSE